MWNLFWIVATIVSWSRYWYLRGYNAGIERAEKRAENMLRQQEVCGMLDDEQPAPSRGFGKRRIRIVR